MANQNLSQFTEKLFVADADHTFIWDTAASISKRVSRNSWLNSGTLTSDAPVTISQTWNNAAVAFTGLKVNAAGTSATNSASGSLLLDLQVGGVSQFKVDKGGVVLSSAAANFPGYTLKSGSATSGMGAGSASNSILFWSGNVSPGFGNANLCLRLDNLHLRHTGKLVFGQIDYGWGAEDTILVRDDVGTLALRNGAAAQTFRVYRSYLNAGVDYERLSFSHDGVQFTIGTERGGSGVAQPLRIFGGSSAALDFATGVTFRNAAGGTAYMTLGSTGITFGADNTYDIGTSGANRPRNVYVGSAITAGGGITGQYFGSSAGGYFNWTTRSNIFSPADGVIRLANDAQTDFNRLQFGGTTNLFPAIKRSTTYLQARLADDSAFAPIQGKLTTDTAYTATVVAATGYITIYDSTGAAYRVPCAV